MGFRQHRRPERKLSIWNRTDSEEALTFLCGANAQRSSHRFVKIPGGVQGGGGWFEA